jgi:hypothetical protein
MGAWGKLSAEPIAPAPIGATVTTTPPAAGDPGGGEVEVVIEKGAEEGDKTLPDPTGTAGAWAAVLLIVAILIGIALNSLELTADAFDPAKVSEANFALFAGFYVGAQVIERLMEFISPLLPWWSITLPLGETPEAKAARAAQIKADRAKLTIGIASVLGVLASGLFGLFFLQAIGMKVSPTVDTILTGITIAAGTKPLHDFITSLQNKDNPNTNTAPSPPTPAVGGGEIVDPAP